MASTVQQPPTLVVRQHIQDHAAATSVSHHWGYADRVVPCVVDAGSCDYLDVVYGAHDQGVVFVGIMWAVLLALFFGFGIMRHLLPSRKSPPREGDAETSSLGAQSSASRLASAVKASFRRCLLPDTALRAVFGRVTRLQVLIVSMLSIYLTMFTFVGYRYETWVTPVKNSPGVYNTRTSLGPFSDRIGILAYALLPLSILLATRESLLSLLTGIPYQNFQPLHRWIGYIIYIQSAVHTIGWTVVEAKLYQPQPKVWTNFIKQTYMIWGVVAMVLITLILVLSFSCTVRRTGGYEVFRKVHYVMAMVFLGACYGHWAQLGCFIIASLAVWGLDRIVRLVRTFLLHYQYLPDGAGMGFQAAQAKVSYFPDEMNGDVVRLDFVHNHAAWEVGQHFYLCFPESSIWQSHPFTPLSLPGIGKEGQKHTYVFRAKGGETSKVAEIARRKVLELNDSQSYSRDDSKSTTVLPDALRSQARNKNPTPRTAVILQGPYGTSHVERLTHEPDVNVLLVAGGSGITFVLPVLFHLMTLPIPVRAGRDRRIELVWAIRRRNDMEWIRPELDTLMAASKRMNLAIRIFVTREDKASAASNLEDVEREKGGLIAVQERAKASCCSSSSESAHDAMQSSAEEAASSSISNSSTPPRRLSIHQPSSADAIRQETRHPDLAKLVTDFVGSTVRGPTSVYASGPGGLVSDLRAAVARCNDGAKVWRGQERCDVRLVGDDRMEW
ncbi:Ferric transmembrane component 4 [Cyphellophora attinorum]|uniref:Ferric transmembrane component 4 n=1 Tax=Cyphellophora attinorum TaxID=1664694 RepID=A0A0N1H7M5_9EURO|nr:Ferric transmembrane component 4 [Phialophora attinorum]KPI37633.1 Ferric transmembrane component 4 [Phialophora attinorum]